MRGNNTRQLFFEFYGFAWKMAWIQLAQTAQMFGGSNPKSILRRRLGVQIPPQMVSVWMYIGKYVVPKTVVEIDGDSIVC